MGKLTIYKWPFSIAMLVYQRVSRMKHQVDSVDVWILFCSFTHWLVGGAPVPRHVSGCSSGFDECFYSGIWLMNLDIHKKEYLLATLW